MDFITTERKEIQIFDILDDEIKRFFSNEKLKFNINESQLWTNNLCSSLSKILNFYFLDKKFLVVSNFFKKGDEDEFQVFFNSLNYSYTNTSNYKIKILPSSFPTDEIDSEEVKIYKFDEIDYFGYIIIFKFD